jgi:hypothetical protein
LDDRLTVGNKIECLSNDLPVIAHRNDAGLRRFSETGYIDVCGAGGEQRLCAGDDAQGCFSLAPAVAAGAGGWIVDIGWAEAWQR